MKVKLSEIPEEGLILSERFDPTAMGLDTPELKFLAPVEVTAEFHREPETVGVSVAVLGRTEEICGRCLETGARPYENRFRLDYETTGRLDLDVTDDIRQEILLSYPVQFLCREDCRGLCPRCGTNLNERSCTHGAS